jgi:predicted transcriptional regulator
MSRSFQPQRRFPTRWWVLLVIGVRGPSTSAEIAEELGLRTEQVSDKIGKMRGRDGLVRVTEQRLGAYGGHAYDLTEKGRSQFLAVRAETLRYVRYFDEAAA